MRNKEDEEYLGGRFGGRRKRNRRR